MKHIQYFFTTAILFLFNFNLYAQIGKVEEINATMSQGTNRGLKVLIPETSQKETIKTWSKLMKDYESKNEKIKKETSPLIVKIKKNINYKNAQKSNPICH